MAITTTSRLHSEILRIEAFGTIINSDDEIQAARACWAEMSQYQVSKVLIDVRKVNFSSGLMAQVMQIQYINESLPDIKLKLIALVIKPEDKRIHDFWELFGRNRGFNWRVFTSSNEAARFLSKENKKS